MKKKQQKKGNRSKRKNYVTTSVATIGKRLGYNGAIYRDHTLELQIADTFPNFSFSKLLEGLTLLKFNFEVYNGVNIEFLDIRIQLTMEQLKDWAFNDQVEDTITN